MYLRDLEVMSSNPIGIELGVRSTSALNRTKTKIYYTQYYNKDYINLKILTVTWAGFNAVGSSFFVMSTKNSFLINKCVKHFIKPKPQKRRIKMEGKQCK